MGEDYDEKMLFDIEWTEVRENSQPIKGTLAALFGITATMSFPTGKKKNLRENGRYSQGLHSVGKESIYNHERHDKNPRVHIQKVIIGRERSSVTGTIRATCSVGE